MDSFLQQYADAAYTTVGFFWMALWAFILGYFISSLIQVFVTQERMQKTMGDDSARSVALGTFFGFISSSCSFSALATTKSLFKKGAGFIASIAFLLASTNLVIELGIVISIFLGWQFVMGEYVGGIMLILISWMLIKLLRPKKLVEQARKNMGEEDGHHHGDEKSLKEKLRSKDSWAQVGQQYAMEWQMVWKDVTIGFTIAGIISSFIPDSFFHALFINTGSGKESYSFFTLLEHVLVGPAAAFLTFIGSMGNIPLAALLYGKGVSFAGIMAFIFSDLVIFPVLRINAKYYGWKMSLFILFLLFTALVITSLLLHYGLDVFSLLPQGGNSKSIVQQEHFKIDYTFFFNIAFLLISGVLVYFGFFTGRKMGHHHAMAPKSKIMEAVLKWLALASYVWLAGGLVVKFFIL